MARWCPRGRAGTDRGERRVRTAAFRISATGSARSPPKALASFRSG